MYTVSGDRMIIYVDILVIVNIYITYFTLKATSAILHLRCRTSRLIVASLLGGFSAIAATFNLNFLLSVIVRFTTTTAITIIAFGFSGIKSLLFRSAVNIASATLVCGITIMLREYTGSTVFNATGGYPYLNISVMTLIIATTLTYTALTIFRRICDKPTTGELIELTIKKDGKTVKLSAFPDSGNNLKDFLTGCPVIVCRKEKLDGIFTAENTEMLPSGTRIIPFSSVGGNGFITAFRADAVTAQYKGTEKNINALIGTGNNALENESFDAIINPKILI